MTLAVDGSTGKTAAPRRGAVAKPPLRTPANLPVSVPVSVTVSPQVRRASTRRSRAIPAFFNILEFGALKGTDCTAAIQSTIDACADSGGGTVLVPAGEYRTGALWLRSNITLHLDSGSKLCGLSDLEAFPPRQSDWEGPGVPPKHTGVINGEALQNVAITGRGSIDGSGKIWWDLFNRNELEFERPKLVRFINCKDVLIDGITLTNSPMWTISPCACDNVTITRVTIRNPENSPNTDGINPDSCANVHIANCHIDVGDDCIAIKCGTEHDGRRIRKACENIIVSGCTMLHGHGGVVIGSEISGGVRNVAIGNCVFRGTDRGIRIKARRGRGSAVEDVRVDNIVMDEVLCPLVVNLFYECGVEDVRLVSDASPHPVTAGTPVFRRLRFSNISARRVKFCAAFVLGLPEMYVDDVVFDNISIFLDPLNGMAGQPAMSPMAPELCRAGFRVRNARGVRVRAVDIREQTGPAFSFESSTDVIIRDVSGGSDHTPAQVQLTGVTNVRGDDSVKLVHFQNAGV